MRPRRVLVVYKKGAYRQYVQEQQDPRLVRLLRQRQPDVLDLQVAHQIHEESLAAVVHALRQLPVQFDLVYRAQLKATSRYDLVVSVGGDGTFLQAASAAIRTPLLGVNSDPSRSEAVFCGATVRTFPGLIRRALAGTLPAKKLYRLQVWLNRRRIKTLALNDVLVVHVDPATMSRYRLSIGSRVEHQKSSGVWIASASGSSSAVLAAGGRRIPWTSKKFQYRPRELYRGRLSRYRLTGGVLSPAKRVRITWLMRRGAIFIDGPHIRLPLEFADEVTVGLSARNPLQILGLS